MFEIGGQSPWMDFIRRDLLDNGELASWVKSGLRGMTSNPTILEQAIAKSDMYTQTIQQLGRSGLTPQQIYERIATEDIGRACDVLQPVYQSSDGADGFVSLEVSPSLSHDSQGTVEEALRLRKAVGRPNLMIKVPATPEGLVALTELIRRGVHVNVTLIFSLGNYRQVVDGYLRGLEARLADGLALHDVHSVASVFVSRIDVAVMQQLAEAERKFVSGKVAIANARMIYKDFEIAFSTSRFSRLREHRANVQRPLWASTGAKDPSLPDVHYIDALVGPDTVNTMPVPTLSAFLDHGSVVRDAIRFKPVDDELLKRVLDFGIDVEEVGSQLQEVGLRQFSESFDNLLETIEQAFADE